MSGAFMSARWSRLAVETFAVPDDVLLPYVFPGLEPDRWQGSAVASAVVFEFEKTKIFGLPAYPFRDFPEWNLRFYVRQKSTGRRGVAFVRELVRSRIVSFVARVGYNEPYVAVPYRFEKTASTIEHAVDFGGRTHRFRVAFGGEPFVPPPDSLAHFLKEQEWGFGLTRSGRLVSYRVQHPLWRVYPDVRFERDVDFGTLYGPRWAFLDDAVPLSRMVAEGSAMTLSPWKSEKEPA